MMEQAAQREDVELSFKRYILWKSEDYASEPEADLFRVNLLGRMLDRYDELIANGMDTRRAVLRVQQDFQDIGQMMSEQGFDLAREEFTASRWAQLSEDEVTQYIQESEQTLHKKSMGTAMCAACVFPMIVGAGVGELSGSWQLQESLTLLGVVGMFAMIGLGVYSMVTATKPKKHDTVKKGRFSLSTRVRKKLLQLQAAVEAKARRRHGKGIALLAACVAPIFVGAAFDSITYASEAGAIFGVAGMFLMIGLGIYEITMASGEKKTIKQLLENEDR